MIIIDCGIMFLALSTWSLLTNSLFCEQFIHKRLPHYRKKTQKRLDISRFFASHKLNFLRYEKPNRKRGNLARSGLLPVEIPFYS